MIVSEPVVEIAQDEQVGFVVPTALRSKHPMMNMVPAGAALVESETERPRTARAVSP